MVTGEMLKVLTEFHHRKVQRMMSMTVKRGAGVEWEYPAVEKAMNSARLHHIGVYTKRRQTTISERVAFRPVYALCMEVERITGTIHME